MYYSPLTTHHSLLNFAMLRRRLESAIGQGHELVVAEQVGGLALHELQNFDGELADFDLGMPAATQLDEVPQGPGISGDENLGLGRVGQDAAGGLAGELAAQRLVRLVP